MALPIKLGHDKRVMRQGLFRITSFRLSDVYLIRFLFIFTIVVLCGLRSRADSIYISYSNTDDTIEKFASGGLSGVNTDDGAFTTANVSTPNGLAFDHSGNLYIANAATGTISKFSSGGTYLGQVASGLSQPAGLAFDRYGNLYVANNGSGTIDQITPGGIRSTFASGMSNPNGLAFDGAGNLYVANGLSDTISKITPGGTVSTFASHDGGYDDINDPMGLAFDASGNLFVANSNINTIEKITPSGSKSVFLSNGTNPNAPADSTQIWSPVGIAFDSSGDLFVSNYHHTGSLGNGYSYIDEYSADGNLLSAFTDSGMKLRDASYIAIENAAGQPLLEAPEPPTCGVFALGVLSFAGIYRIRRARRLL